MRPPAKKLFYPREFLFSKLPKSFNQHFIVFILIVDLEPLISKLILDDYLHQDISINDTHGTASAYIRLG
jgi:hypothetical protein